MYSLLFLGVISFLLSLILTPLVRNAFRWYGLLDRPDSNRKRHAHPVPKAGGIPLAFSFLASFGLLFVVNFRGANFIETGLPLASRIIPAALIVFATGLLDDLFGLKPWQKLAGQLVAAGAAYWAGVQIQALAGRQLQPWLSLPVTVLWLVLCTNAVNLIDGVDGLATGVGLFASATTLLAALLQKNFGLAAATMPLVGALFGFLRYNFNPATVFLGDSGSLLIGFLLGSYGVWWSQKSATILGMTAPLMALSIPLLDTALAIARRFLRRQSILLADRGHIHHRLLDRGLTPRRVALILYSMCGIAAIFSLCVSSQHFDRLALVVFCGAAWVGIQHLGYIELGVAGRMFLEGAFRRQLSARISLECHEELLDAATSVQDCWSVIEKASREFGFCSGRMTLGDRTFAYGGDCGHGSVWRILVPLEDAGSLELIRHLGETWPSEVVSPFVEMLTRTLSPKIPALTAFQQSVPARREMAAAAPTLGRSVLPGTAAASSPRR